MSEEITFALQSTWIPEREQLRTLSAIQNIGANSADVSIHENIGVIGLNDIPERTIFIGSTSLIKKLYNLKYSGIYFNHDTFNYFRWWEYLNGDLLNSDFKAIQAMDIKHHFFKKRKVFIRSPYDFKGSPSGVFSIQDIESLAIKDEVIVASVKPIEFEWRLFYVGMQYVTGSQYRKHGETIHDSFVPDYVINYANKIKDIWAPHHAFALDICLSNGEMKVMEFNCINCSGFYECDREKLLKALSMTI